ncbi:MAG: dTDP-4-dehydrorhamnose 3,5-epimerase [Desulfuromusa sp.]|nr:dTDP-4-dehydrorhamnose 3,5-epimerase [Desulfuromusa sp.]
MTPVLIDGVTLHPEKQIFHPQGDVFHAIKSNSPGFVCFGEAYFSSTLFGETKGWKKHLRMTLNLLVPIGSVRFVCYDDRSDSPTFGVFSDVTIGVGNYQRLTVEPGIWVAFQGVGNENNLLLNVADMIHDPDEVERCELNEIIYAWNSGT